MHREPYAFWKGTEGGVEVCPEMLICSTTKELRKFMEQTAVKGAADSSPCSLQPTFDPTTLQDLLVRKANLIRQVELLEERVYPRKMHS